MQSDIEIVRANRGLPMFADKPVVGPDTYEPVGPIAVNVFPQLQKLLDLRK
ncbi:MAG: hypothetical protein IPK82_24950 [Polyangiaceae bacterium]|nr:hypothetical protein [Polyangiaceae bacterium]